MSKLKLILPVIALTLAASAATAATCTPTGFFRDGINMTAAVINPPGTFSGPLDATGCNIGIFYSAGATGTVNSAEISGANYFGIVVNGDSSVVSVDVSDSSIHDIGEDPFNGTQHGVAVYYRSCPGGSATGTVSGNSISNYQKGAIVANCEGVSVQITDNTVTGFGPVSFIAQNGIQVGFGASATVMRNTVTGNSYSGSNCASSGGVLVVGGDCYGGALTTKTQIVKNTLTGNDVGAFLSNLDASCNPPSTQTNVKVINNVISNEAVSNTTGNAACTGPYQAGISDQGNNDKLINNNISGLGYNPVSGPGIFAIDQTATNHPKVHANTTP